MIRKQIWKPDTCECVVEQTFDYSTDPATLIEQIQLNRCPYHVTAEEVVTENQTKNFSIGKVAEILNVKPEDIEWEHDENRNLELNPPEVLTAEEKISVETELSEIDETIKINSEKLP